MSNDETARELAKLRADVAALTAAREKETQEEAEEPTEQPAPAAPAATAEESSPELVDEHKTQLGELGDLLHAEIRDLPTITCLTVFSLGIIMGRLMR